MTNDYEDFLDEVEDEEEEFTSDNDDHDEDDSEGEGDDEEEETYTFTKSELDERLRETKKEQDKRWKDRFKKAGKETGTEEESTGKKESEEVENTRLDRLELKGEGIKDKEQQDFVIEYAKTKKIDVGDALKARVVRAELRELDKQSKKDGALPKTTNRTETRKADDVSYWAQQLEKKGKKAPTAEMRRKVLKHLAGKK